MRKYASGEADILLGTQMVAKGLDLEISPDVVLVDGNAFDVDLRMLNGMKGKIVQTK